jgi:hypothetical protein
MIPAAHTTGTLKQRNHWVIATALWITLIFVSCTAAAGQWAEQAYSLLALVFARSPM